MSDARPARWLDGLRAVTRLAPHPRFVRFLGGGLLNTLFGYAVFVLTSRLGASIASALLTSTLASLLFNFQTSRRIVFNSHQNGRLLPFTIIYATIVAINYVALLLLQHFGLPPFAAQAVMVAPVAVLSFTAQQKLVFTDS